MGVLFSRFRSKASTKDLLDDIQKEIDSLLEYKHSTELQQKTLIRSLVFYSVLFYIIIAGFFLFYSYPITTKDKLVYAIPFLIFPILLYILKKFLQWYFVQKIRRNDENLFDLKKRKKSLLEFAMETETYKVVKELLEKYDPEYHRKVFEPRPAIQAAPQLYRGSFTELDLRRRNTSPKQPSPPIALGNTAGKTITVNNTAVRPPMPPMPRPVLPRERTIVDRLVDYVVGDGPSNRYALICRQCLSHNGMALKEEFEYIAFRCCYCFQFNPPRNQQPPPPKLTLPAPTAPPAIEAPLSGRSSTSGDETDAGNISDNDSSPIITPQETSVADDSQEFTHDLTNQRLSISSDVSEIQANLVEDLPQTSPDKKDESSTHEETFEAES
ncbi:endoplasmic reticulum junction formation protein lunapark-A isoform X2 [Parasteatoda tepidariorum]|uniref:endoplasmic reticulum junction formation protein lunapark-A isoform X2 n=1 Tax=Parasteatoda tepidariorum TaxID=114398 RepID=UPI000A2C059F|nr:endoplasmic reticulum junction formation protein lunapark-A isoform X2 [Parasteatoda tepidariorum]